MKFQKLVIPALALGLFAAVPAIHAQDEKAPATEAKPERKEKGPRGGGRMNPEQMVARLDEALSLTDDQKAKIKDIYVKAQDQMKELAPDERREKGREIMKSTHDAVRAVLTADQQTKFDELRPGPGGERRKKKNKEE